MVQLMSEPAAGKYVRVLAGNPSCEDESLKGWLQGGFFPSKNFWCLLGREKGSTMFAARSQIRLMSERFISQALILVVSLCLWCPQAMAAENPEEVIKTGTEQILKLVKQYPEDTRARREKIQAVIDGYFDFEAMARLAVGPRWRNLSAENQQEFTREFSRLLFNTYIGDIEEYAGQEISYKTRSIYQGYVVVEVLVREQGGTVSLDYNLHLRDGNWKVYDVDVQGMSLIVNYRDQFDPILANGSFDDLSRKLRREIAHICASNRC